MLVAGLVVILIGIFDYVLAVVVARDRAAGAPGGLGPRSEPPGVARILKRSSALTIVAGAVLVALGLGD